MPKQLVNLTPIQKRLYHDQHRFIVNPAGRRSRKTLIAKRKVFLQALQNTGYKYFHGAPTHKQAKDIFWNDLKAYTQYFRVDKSETDLMVRLINQTEIHVIGLDKPERIEGQPWHGCHITEFANIKDLAWEENIRPVLSDTRGFAILDGVPEGRNHYYDKALYAAGGALPETIPFDGAYAENPNDPEWVYYSWFSADVLDLAEIESAKNVMDSRTYRQEYQGSFETYEGLAYWNFGLHNLKDCEFEENNVISIGMDFNVDPMTCTLGHIKGDGYYQFGERWLENSNTYEMAQNLKESFNVKQCVIYPDSTGRARESNATESDLKILKDAGFTVRAKPSNPYQKDRVNAVNSLMKSMDGTVRYFINGKNCPKTVNDLNKAERLADGRLNSKQETEQKIHHISAGLGYLIYYNWPMKQLGDIIKRAG